jgi:hypothetical protein
MVVRRVRLPSIHWRTPRRMVVVDVVLSVMVVVVVAVVVAIVVAAVVLRQVRCWLL